MSWIIRCLMLAVGGAAIAAAFVVDFNTRARMSDRAHDLPGTAIVFTGRFDRIHRGLDLMEAGRVDLLFISGANPMAGIHKARFVAQFGLTQAQAEALAAGRIVLAQDAQSTLENGLETKCWLDAHPDIQAVTLITSTRHMARASLALERAIPRISVVRVASDPSSGRVKWHNNLAEFRDFLATWAITLLPPAAWPANQPTLCDPR